MGLEDMRQLGLCPAKEAALRALAHAVADADELLDVDLARAARALSRVRGLADTILSSTLTLEDALTAFAEEREEAKSPPRVEWRREAGRLGGRAIVTRYGSQHMQQIGRKGGQKRALNAAARGASPESDGVPSS